MEKTLWKHVKRWKDVAGTSHHLKAQPFTPFFALVTSKHMWDEICSEGHGSLVQLKENQHIEALQDEENFQEAPRAA